MANGTNATALERFEATITTAVREYLRDFAQETIGRLAGSLTGTQPTAARAANGARPKPANRRPKRAKTKRARVARGGRQEAALKLLATRKSGLTVNEIADTIGMRRTNVWKLMQTLTKRKQAVARGKAPIRYYAASKQA